MASPSATASTTSHGNKRARGGTEETVRDALVSLQHAGALLESMLAAAGKEAGVGGTRADEDEARLNAEQCPDPWKSHIASVVFTSEQVQRRVRELAATISRDYQGKEIVAVGLLTGAICFTVDLVKHLQVPYTMDFMAVSSYRGLHSKGTVELKKDMTFDPAGKHILIVEDIVDTGGTLTWLRNYLRTKNCASIRVACLLDKKEGRTMDNVVVDYVGFVCPNKFVVGYGLDFNQKYRGLPFIGVLQPHVYQKGEEE